MVIKLTTNQQTTYHHHMTFINRCKLWHNNWFLIHFRILSTFSENIFDITKLVLLCLFHSS